MALHKILLRSRPFNAIKNGTKTVEVRTNKKIGRLDIEGDIVKATGGFIYLEKTRF